MYIGEKYTALNDIKLLHTTHINKDDIVEITDYNETTGLISFIYGEQNRNSCVMSLSMFNSNFKKLEKNEVLISRINFDYIEAIMDDSEFEVVTVFDKCTIVTCKLPNGFVITESYTFSNAKEYDENEGIEICLDKIADKIMEFETYTLHNTLYRFNAEHRENNCCECDNYDACDEHADYEEDDDEEELDCMNCTDYDCPDHPSYNSIKH